MLLCHKGTHGLKVNALAEGSLRNRLACAEILVQNGADVNCRGDGIFMTPLHWAAYNNDVGVLKLLLQSGAKISVNKSGRAPIDLAGFCRHKEAVKVFVDDCESKIMDTLSGTPLLSKRDFRTGKTPYIIDRKIRPENSI